MDKGKKTKLDRRTILYLLITVIVVVAMAAIALSLSASAAGGVPIPRSVNVHGITYSGSGTSCVSSGTLLKYGYKRVCTESLSASGTNYTTPNYFMLSYYEFVDSNASKQFITGLESDLNTTPWPNNITTSAQVLENVTYTQILYPQFNNTNKSAIVIAEYMRNGNTVLGVSTANFTKSGNLAEFKAYTNLVMGNIVNGTNTH